MIKDNLRVPKLLHLPNDRSIEPHKTGWSSYVWLDLVGPIL
jgi:hypothetical protein